MSATNEEYMNRRKLWALMPSKYHKGKESCIQKPGELDYKFSFFGQGLTLLIAYFPQNKWNILESNNIIVWAVNDSTEVLSEFYAIDIYVLDTIYNIQCIIDHERKQLVDIIMDTPIYVLD